MNENQIQPIIKQAQAITISDKQSMEEATVVLSLINKKLDEITEDKEKLTKPLNTALKEIRDRYRPWETQLTAQKDIIRTAMGQYQLEATKRAELEAQEIADRIAPGKGNLSMETALERLAGIDTPDAKTTTDFGSVSFRKDKVLKVLDITKIPQEYFDLNESRLTKDLKAKITVPGATLEDKLTPVNSR